MPEESEKTKAVEKRITVTFSTTPEIKAWIEESAELDDRSISKWLSRMFREIMQGENKTLQP